MDIFFGEYLDRLETLHDNIKEALAGLPAEALDWRPGPEMNSIAVLVVHVAGAERYWIRDVAAQEPSGRNRATEFETKGVPATALSERLDESLAYTRTALARLSPADLAQARSSAQHEQTFTVAWSLLHALEHTAIHAGHIGLTKQLWEAR